MSHEQQVEYWEDGVFQCNLEQKAAKEIAKDHKRWGNGVKIDGNRYYITIKRKAKKSEDKEERNTTVGYLTSAHISENTAVAAAVGLSDGSLNNR